MSTATMTRTKKATDEPLREINGLTFKPTCTLDKSEQRETESINFEVDDIARSEDELNDERAEVYKNWLDMTHREIQSKAVDMRPRIDAIEERKREVLNRRHDLLPRCEAAYSRRIAELEQELQATLESLADKFRKGGIDEFSMPAGEHAGANQQGAREMFLRKLRDEPEALVVIGKLNKAKSDIQVLISQYPIMPTANNTCVKWRGVDAVVPDFVTQLFF